jgi:hypothetical protein
MADTITTLSLITLAQEFRGDVVKQINRRTVALRLFPIVPGEGKNIGWVPEGDGQLAENYSDGADAANFGGDSQTSATLNWGLYRANLHVSNLTMDAAASASTPEGDRMIWARNVINGSAKLASLLNAAFYSGAGTGTLWGGLDTAIGSLTNTYATIDRTVGGNAFWLPTVVDPGSLTKPTFAQIRDDIRKIYIACGENPDVAICSPGVFNAIGNLFDNTRRQVDQIMTARGKVRLEFGFQAIEVDGMYFVKDKDATEHTIYYCNSNHVRIEVLPPAEYRQLQIDDWEEVEADDGYGMVPLMLKYEKLAKLGASERAETTSTAQVVVDRPNSCGVRKNVDIT